MRRVLYHLVPRATWEAASADDASPYAPPSLATEGFVHCSYADQLVATAARYYAGRHDLVVLQIDPAALRCPVRDEPVRDTRFPHVYGAIEQSAIVAVFDLPLGRDGQFTLPSEIEG